MENIQEIWRPVKGYEGLYEVSNYGRVRSLNYHRKKGRVFLMKPCVGRAGYYQLILRKNGGKITAVVHRLVAEAFLPNPDNLPCVNHKDENKENNAVWNLEWCTFKYNTNYGTAMERVSIAKTNGKRSKPVIAVDPKTMKTVMFFPSQREAHRNGYRQSRIWEVVTPESDRYGMLYKGYLWRYADSRDSSA